VRSVKHYSGKLLGGVAERLIAALMAVVGLVVPRSKHLWAFGSSYGSRFADNPKHFFLYCHSLDRSPVRAVWLSRSRSVIEAVRSLGLPAHHRYSPRGLWYALRAGVYVMDSRVMDVSPVGTRGALRVNLWHGVPLKKIERDIEQSHHPIARAYRGSLAWRTVNKVLRPQLTESYDCVLATSSETARRFGSAFGVSPDQLITVGYPRTDPLLGPRGSVRFLTRSEHDAVEQFRLATKAGRRVLLYLPTFRDWNNGATRRIPIDWTALDRTLEATGGVLYCKLHPSDQTALPSLAHCRNIRALPAAIDVYSLLAHADALISDYSSIFFDYLLLDKPILFYPYDLEEYQRLSRTLYDPYDDVTPGPKAYTAAELDREVARLLRSYDEAVSTWRAARAAVRDRFFEYVDDRASERLLSALLARVA
jgi:CDP-glycerol glycerophosphotransferase (TagB/SpsB family)